MKVAMGRSRRKNEAKKQIQDRDRIGAGQGRLIKSGAKTLGEANGEKKPSEDACKKTHQKQIGRKQCKEEIQERGRSISGARRRHSVRANVRKMSCTT